jgi:hypothetical protein
MAAGVVRRQMIVSRPRPTHRVRDLVRQSAERASERTPVCLAHKSSRQFKLARRPLWPVDANRKAVRGRPRQPVVHFISDARPAVSFDFDFAATVAAKQVHGGAEAVRALRECAGRRVRKPEAFVCNLLRGIQQWAWPLALHESAAGRAREAGHTMQPQAWQQTNNSQACTPARCSARAPAGHTLTHKHTRRRRTNLRRSGSAARRESIIWHLFGRRSAEHDTTRLDSTRLTHTHAPPARIA